MEIVYKQIRMYKVFVKNNKTKQKNIRVCNDGFGVCFVLQVYKSVKDNMSRDIKKNSNRLSRHTLISIDDFEMKGIVINTLPFEYLVVKKLFKRI